MILTTITKLGSRSRIIHIFINHIYKFIVERCVPNTFDDVIICASTDEGELLKYKLKTCMNLGT